MCAGDWERLHFSNIQANQHLTTSHGGTGRSLCRVLGPPCDELVPTLRLCVGGFPFFVLLTVLAFKKRVKEDSKAVLCCCCWFFFFNIQNSQRLSWSPHVNALFSCFFFAAESHSDGSLISGTLKTLFIWNKNLHEPLLHTSKGEERNSSPPYRQARHPWIQLS